MSNKELAMQVVTEMDYEEALEFVIQSKVLGLIVRNANIHARQMVDVMHLFQYNQEDLKEDFIDFLVTSTAEMSMDKFYYEVDSKVRELYYQIVVAEHNDSMTSTPEIVELKDELNSLGNPYTTEFIYDKFKEWKMLSKEVGIL